MIKVWVTKLVTKLWVGEIADWDGVSTPRPEPPLLQRTV